MTAPVMPTSSVVASAPCAPPTGNLVPLLHEIRHALTRWLEQGEEHVIDLRSIPLAPGEEDRLLEHLGEGEVKARLSILGPSDIIETRYPAVWLITHYNENESITGRFIEVCEVPGILKSQADDSRAGLEHLEDELSNAETRA
ncbi:MAG: hydrogenase expression/formation C-terminal domain-containing protein [Pseudomonadota bacterium]|nr:hydrogenase expression/formation C-terminal domain-containing protein [Pseudomonadota bacterium]